MKCSLRFISHFFLPTCLIWPSNTTNQQKTKTTTTQHCHHLLFALNGGQQQNQRKQNHSKNKTGKTRVKSNPRDHGALQAWKGWQRWRCHSAGTHLGGLVFGSFSALSNLRPSALLFVVWLLFFWLFGWLFLPQLLMHRHQIALFHEPHLSLANNRARTHANGNIHASLRMLLLTT